MADFIRISCGPGILITRSGLSPAVIPGKTKDTGMKTKKTSPPLAPLLAASLMLAACRQPAANPTASSTAALAVATTAPAGQPTAGANLTTPPKPTVEGGGEGGVESALVTYSDAAQGFAIAHPSNWTQDSSFTAGVKFVGGDSSLILE